MRYELFQDGSTLYRYAVGLYHAQKQPKWCMKARCDTLIAHSSRIVSMGRDLYAFFESGSCSVYRLSDDQWHDLPSARATRSYHQAACDRTRQHIYLAGSCKKFNSQPYKDTRSCERFSVTTLSWTEMPLMNHSRWGASLIVHDDHLFALGGRTLEDDATRSDAERMCLATCSKWIMMPPMKSPREDALVLACSSFS